MPASGATAPHPVSRRVRGAAGAIATLVVAALAVPARACDLPFADGFEYGNTLAWGCAPANVASGSGTLETSDGATHTYYYRIPATNIPPGGRAVVIWLHGDGGSGNGYGAGFYPYTDPAGAMVVTPSANTGSWTHAAGDLPGQSQDAQFLSDLIDLLIAGGVAGQTVDSGRIYVGGESRGAYMPYYLLQRGSTRTKIAAVAVNAGLLYCQAGDAECEEESSDPVLHQVRTPILHLHGTNDTAVEPPPTATFHHPDPDWSVDWRVFWPMKLWAEQNGCFGGDNSTGLDDGVLQETYTVYTAGDAKRYDLEGWGAGCARYQLVLVTNGGHVIPGQYGRIWSFLSSWQLGD
jgi:poly(3-hydroxybutyrate) depolymerase